MSQPSGPGPDSLAFAMNGRLANPKTEEAPKPEEPLVCIKGRRADKQPPSTAHAHLPPKAQDKDDIVKKGGDKDDKKGGDKKGGDDKKEGGKKGGK